MGMKQTGRNQTKIDGRRPAVPGVSLAVEVSRRLRIAVQRNGASWPELLSEAAGITAV